MIYYFLMKSGELCTIEQYDLSIDIGILKKLICSQNKIQEDNIILIANGGFCLQDGVLSVYNCGDNEDNPVFVYLRENKRLLREIGLELPLDKEFQRNINRIDAVIKKSGSTFLVLQENELISSEVLRSSKRISHEIETAIRDQFLLVEGWNAAVANLCDSLQSLEKRILAMKDNLSRFRNSELEEGFDMMTKFESRKSELENIPLLASLLGDTDNESDQSERATNLLQWVLATSPHVTVQSVVNEAHQAYLTIVGASSDTAMTVDDVQSSWGKYGIIAHVLKAIENGEQLVGKCRPVEQQQCQGDSEEERSLETSGEHYTSIRAYMKRLNDLETVRTECGRVMGLIESHGEYMTSTVKQCQDVAGYSILQDHCVNSRLQMDFLRKPYSQLSGLLRKVVSSKTDLVSNIDERKSWLMKYETSICQIDEQLFFAKETIKRVRAGCKVLTQMGSAPRIYAQGVTETFRRGQFVDLWYSWGTLCSQQSRDLRQKDREMRLKIDADLENHFIQTLFSSLHSFSLPRIGDRLLTSSKPVIPLITEADIEFISSNSPSLIPFLHIPRPSLAKTVNSPHALPIGTVATEFRDSRNTDSATLSMPALECVSLMPVPQDSHLQLQDLFLSINDHQLDDQLKHAVTEVDCSEAASSRIARSIDSMEFQLTNDKTTETDRDLVCVSRTTIDSLLSCFRELRARLDAVTRVYLLHVEEQREMVTETTKLLCASSERGHNVPERPPALVTACPVDSVCMKHRQFSAGDTVCFTSQTINGSLQWRMLSSDRRVYFLHDSCIVPKCAVGGVRSSSVAGMTPSEPSSDTRRPPSTPLALVWGSFQSKEEYISRKTTNRYSLPVNTKFYRVHATVDWSPSPE